MNLIFLYDSGTNDFAMVGLGNSTSIEDPLTVELAHLESSILVLLIKYHPTAGTMGKFDWEEHTVPPEQTGCVVLVVPLLSVHPALTLAAQ